MKRSAKTATFLRWAIVLLVVLAPLPEGSAYPWALPLIEVLVFGLVAVGVLAVALGNERPALLSRGRPLALPVLLFVALVMLQIAPLPPRLLRIVSPATHRLYELSLPGWPREHSGQVLTVHAAQRELPQWRVLPTADEIAGGAQMPFAPSSGRTTAGGSVRRVANGAPASMRWRQLSIAPSMSKRVLLELVAYAGLFFLILLYPFGSAGIGTERRVYRSIVMAVLLGGLIVAVVGIIEFFTWNGKILWLFVPYDWGAPAPGALSRAVGPFVNPDHFGDYLALVLPLAVGEALFRSDLFSRQRAFRVFCAVTSFLILCALLLSLSRAAWIGAAIALALLFALSARMPQTARPRLLSFEHGTLPRRAGVLAFAVIALSLLFIGPEGRRQVDLRLQQTVSNDTGFGGRFELAADTLAMARDYPAFGVGLGCWPELFPHYRRPPWSAVMYREVHNDYAQLLAETGIVGFALAAWFFVAIGRRLYRALAQRATPVSPTLAAVCAALAVVAFHEFFDFSLHTPANAVLFTVLLALALRMAGGPSQDRRSSFSAGPGLRMVSAGCVAALAVTLIVFALRQEKIPYPHNINPPDSAAGAQALIYAHPAESAPHRDLVQLGAKQLSTRQRVKELRAAVWLDPTNPYARDAYVRALLRQGMTAQALNDLTRSVLASPSLSTHAYLSGRLIPWLSAAEKQAVEKGFKQAVARRYDGAVQGLAAFYVALGRFADAGDLYRRAAGDQRDSDLREQYLVGAGVSYAQSGDLENARKCFDWAIRNDPADVRPYQYLATMVFGPRHELTAARNMVAQGVRAGADGSALYEALAQAAQSDGDAQITESALRDAVNAQPTFTALFRLGMFYLGERKYDRAALTIRRAAEADPRSAEAYFYLGVAEESGYRFSAAERDFAWAVRLAPTNAGYRAHYLDFEHRVAQSIRNSPPLNE